MSNGLRADSGPGAPLVACIHGSMDRHASFARLRARLVPTCDVLVYDRRGYAGSRDAEPPAAGMDDHVADLVDLLEGRHAVLFGHSYGGDVALALAERHPELVATAVVFEPPAPWLDFWHAPGTARDRLPWSGTTPEESAERFLRRMIGDRRYERIPAATRARTAEGRRRARHRARPPSAAIPRRSTPPRIDVPVVVAWGSRNPRAAPPGLGVAGELGSPRR